MEASNSNPVSQKAAASSRPAIGRRSMPYQKYKAYPRVDLPDRTWPSNTLTKAPRWCSVDLRDGNQALLEPMTPREKLQMFELLVDLGFKEIEVGFPAASQLDYDFVRTIIEQNMIPEDVTIQVLCQARKALIDRTSKALQGTPRVIWHLYNPTSTLQRKVVFQMSRREVIDLALQGAIWIKQAAASLTDTESIFEYSPESFTGTELEFAVEICEQVCNEWGATVDAPVIINLPATVEMSSPNIYADQIEWFGRQFGEREHIVLSLHTHNDRGTGIAATELGLLAGADRIEGTLFGNGERTGNVDIITLAMNLFSQGVDPQLDLRDMPDIVSIVETCNKLPVHQRHPYAGELVFTSFSGSHQDAIRKGLATTDASHWEVPYLPIDPGDVGASYRETVRVNSQSGKGGVAFVLEHYFGVALTRSHLIEFAAVVQQLTEELGGELTPKAIWQAFQNTYIVPTGHYQLLDYSLTSGKGKQRCQANLLINGSKLTLEGVGMGPIEAFVQALRSTLNEPFEIHDYHEYALGKGSGVNAIAEVAIRVEESVTFGVGISQNTLSASLEAIVSALNRRWGDTPAAADK